MKYFILISIFLMLMCCTINCVTATENNTINHNVFINNISDVINEIDYNNPITNHSEYIQSHINYINTLTNNFKSSCLNHNEKKFNLTNNRSVVNISDSYISNGSNLVNLSTGKDKYNVVLFNGSSYNQSQYNRSSKLGLNNSFVNNVSKELNISKEVNLTNNINKSSNIHYNKFNLLNLTIDKNKQGIVLFNDTLHNKNQYNKTCKLGLNNNSSINPVINNKELNISKSNSNM